MEGPGVAARVWDEGGRMDEMIVLPVKTSQHHCQRSQPVALPWGQTLLSFRSLPSSPDHILVSLPQGWPRGAWGGLVWSSLLVHLAGISPASPSKVFLWLWEDPGSRLLIPVTIPTPLSTLSLHSLLSSSGMHTMCKALGLNAVWVPEEPTKQKHERM